MTFGSFDRYFYTEEAGKDTDRRATMKLEARRLKKIVRLGLKSYKTGRRERVYENRPLTEEELKHVSRILGRTYESAHIVKHSLYPGNRGQDLSVVFRRGLEYSEAFAGSGEIAAVSAVVQILSAPKNSLILLDEPETSLHPGAQRALLYFLLEQIKLKFHQVVISTHSSDFLDGMPPEAIKVFEENSSGQTRVIDKCSPYVALHRLGRPSGDKLRVLVEDPLAEAFVRHAAKALDKGEADVLEVKVAPGGAKALISHHGTAAMASGDDVYLLLDGDMQKVGAFVERDTIAPADYNRLDEILLEQLGSAPKFLLAGGNDVAGHEQASIKAHLDYLEWVAARLRYLPRKCPEEVLLNFLSAEECAKVTDSESAKTLLREYLCEGQELNAQEIFVLEKFHVAKIPLDNPDLESIRDVLRGWIHQ
ncbi:AAA ATPase domain protein [compost metagenome]